eukprot:848594-Prorocentrum_minimum.AAC.1
MPQHPATPIMSSRGDVGATGGIGCGDPPRSGDGDASWQGPHLVHLSAALPHRFQLSRPLARLPLKHCHLQLGVRRGSRGGQEGSITPTRQPPG